MKMREMLERGSLYRNCQRCDLDLGYPSLASTILGVEKCQHCGADNVMTDDERMEVADDFENRLRAQELGAICTSQK